MTQAQLYKASVLSGLKNMTWAESIGLTIWVSPTHVLQEAYLSPPKASQASEQCYHLQLETGAH